MLQRALKGSLAAAAAIVLMASCGPGETPEQKLERLRYNHEIFPLGSQTVFDQDGEPTLLVDLQVVNQGTQSLSSLTIFVRVRDEHGQEKLARRVTLDLTDVRPGVGVQMAAVVPGFGLAELDEVEVELEPNLPAEILRELPEFKDVAEIS